MIRDYPSSSQPTWRLIAQEAAAFAAAGLLMPFGIRSPSRRTPRAKDQRTVVLVHGYLANRSTLFPLAAYLRLRGVKQILHFNYDSRAGVERGALGLREFLRRHVRGGRIDLVGHSLGGLVARVYVEALGGSSPRRPLRHPRHAAPRHLQLLLAVVARRRRAAAGFAAAGAARRLALPPRGASASCP